MDKYQLIDSAIVQVDALVDMRGATKCRTVLDVIAKLTALKKGLAEDDEAQKKLIEELTAKGMKQDDDD